MPAPAVVDLLTHLSEDEELSIKCNSGAVHIQMCRQNGRHPIIKSKVIWIRGLERWRAHPDILLRESIEALQKEVRAAAISGSPPVDVSVLGQQPNSKPSC